MSDSVSVNIRSHLLHFLTPFEDGLVVLVFLCVQLVDRRGPHVVWTLRFLVRRVPMGGRAGEDGMMVERRMKE